MPDATPIRTPWPGTMTARERFRRQMDGQSVDRCFNMEFGYWDENYRQWTLFRDNGITNEAEANRFFGFDRIETSWSNVWLSPAFEPAEVSRDEKKGTRVVLNGDGLHTEVALDGHSSIPHCLASSVVTPDDWKRVKEERMRRDDPARVIDTDGLLAAHPNDRDYPLGVSTGSMIGKIRDMLTFEGLCYAMADYPEMVEDMVETCCVLVEDALDQVLGKVQFDYAAGWEDICFKNGPIVRPDFFDAVVGPRYARIHKKLKAHGISLWYTDCDGDVRPLMETFLDNGINCMFPYEVNSCLHPKAMMDKYEGRLKIMGGIDKMQLKAGREAIRAYLDSVAPLVARGGYIPFCDHRCPPNVRTEDYLYYLDLKEKMFGMG